MASLYRTCFTSSQKHFKIYRILEQFFAKQLYDHTAVARTRVIGL